MLACFASRSRGNRKWPIWSWIDLVAINNDSYRAHLRRARYLQQYNHGEGSKEDVAIALKLAKDDPDVIIVAAQAAMLEDKLDEGQALLARGLKLYPKNVSMYRQWAGLKSTQNKLGEAEAEVEKGIKLLPGNPEMLWILCNIQLQKRDLRRGRGYARKAAEDEFSEGAPRLDGCSHLPLRIAVARGGEAFRIASSADGPNAGAYQAKSTLIRPPVTAS